MLRGLNKSETSILYVRKSLREAQDFRRIVSVFIGSRYFVPPVVVKAFIASLLDLLLFLQLLETIRELFVMKDNEEIDCDARRWIRRVLFIFNEEYF